MSAVSSEEPEGAHFDPAAARTRWQRLDSETRRRILRAARQGRPIPEGRADSRALRRAWAILGPPWNRRHPRWYDHAAMFLNKTGAYGGFTDRINRTGGSARRRPGADRPARRPEHRACLPPRPSPRRRTATGARREPQTRVAPAHAVGTGTERPPTQIRRLIDCPSQPDHPARASSSVVASRKWRSLG